MLVADCEGRLAEKVARQLGRIVPAGVFKIQEAQTLVRRQDGVVKTKVGRREASLVKT